MEIWLLTKVQWPILWSRRKPNYCAWFSNAQYELSGVGFSVGVIASVVFFRRSSNLSRLSRVQPNRVQDVLGLLHYLQGSAQVQRTPTVTVLSILPEYQALVLSQP